MTTKLLALILSLGSLNALAITCETDQECLTEGLSLIKKARKLGSCDAEVKAAAATVESVATPGEELRNLEMCVARAKKQARVNKKFQKRQQRIQKAMEQGVAAK